MNKDVTWPADNQDVLRCYVTFLGPLRVISGKLSPHGELPASHRAVNTHSHPPNTQSPSLNKNQFCSRQEKWRTVTVCLKSADPESRSCSLQLFQFLIVHLLSIPESKVTCQSLTVASSCRRRWSWRMFTRSWRLEWFWSVCWSSSPKRRCLHPAAASSESTAWRTTASPSASSKPR